MTRTTQERRCRECGASEFNLEPSPPPHRAKLVCVTCGRFWGFLSIDKKDRRSNSHRDLARKVGIEHCQVCGMNREELAQRGETLHGHHVYEYRDGGEPTRENTWVLCTSHHELLHWARKERGSRPRPQAGAPIQPGPAQRTDKDDAFDREYGLSSDFGIGE